MNIEEIKDKVKNINDKIEVVSSNPNEIDYSTKLLFNCKKHGYFYSYLTHIKCGCPNCRKEKRFLAKQIEFIEKAKKTHGDKYDYSKVGYMGNKEKVCIICPKHGEFWILPSNHCSTHNQNGCPQCAFEKNACSKRKDVETFIKEAKKIHKDKYDYSKVEYINNKTKVCIICPTHGEFWQTPHSHLKGQGCPECVALKGGRKSTTEEFIEKAKQIHGGKYDYSKVKYTNSITKVCIICPEHGEFWQRPTNHLNGNGCILCNRTKNENSIGEFLDNEGIKYVREYSPIGLSPKRIDYFLIDYNIAIEYQGEQHFHPVKHFGGEKRFNDRITRDKIKKEWCEVNNIKLLYFSFYKNTTYKVINNFKELKDKIYEIKRVI